MQNIILVKYKAETNKSIPPTNQSGNQPPIYSSQPAKQYPLLAQARPETS